jgi:hypothetical protein
MITLPATSVPTIHPHLYPRDYQVDTGWPRLVLWFAVATGLGVAVPSWYGIPSASLILLPLTIPAALLGAGTLLTTRRSKVTLTADAIRVAGLYQARRLKRADITGYQLVHGPDGQQPTIVLVAERKKPRKLKLPPIIGMDDAFRGWIETLPLLDGGKGGLTGAAAAARPTAPMPAAGAGQTLFWARELAWGLNIAAMVMAFTFAHGGPGTDRYGALAAMLAALPFVAIGLTWRLKGTLEFGPPRSGGRPWFTIALVAPALGLARRTYLDFPVLDGSLPLLATLIGSAVLVALTILADRDLLRYPVSCLLVPLLVCHALACARLANALMDRSPPEVFAARVVCKSVTCRKAPNEWYLGLSPWGPQREARAVSVALTLYDAVAVGDTVRVELRPGFLSMPWFGVSACRSGYCGD